MSARLAGLLSLSALLLAGALHAQDSKPLPTVKPGVTLKPQPRQRLELKLRPEVLRCTGPDLAVTTLYPARPSRNADGSTTFALMVRVRNTGTAAFEHDRQARLSLYRARRRIASYPIREPRLEAGAEISTQAVVSGWTGGEFAEGVSALLVYDPDMSIDGNPASEDCNLRNNRRALTAAQVAEQLARYGG